MFSIKSRAELNDYLQKKDIQTLKEYHFINSKNDFSNIKKGDYIAFISKIGGIIPIFGSTFQELEDGVIRVYCYEKRSVLYLSLETHFIYWKKRTLKIRKRNDDLREFLLEALNKLE